MDDLEKSRPAAPQAPDRTDPAGDAADGPTEKRPQTAPGRRPNDIVIPPRPVAAAASAPASASSDVAPRPPRPGRVPDPSATQQFSTVSSGAAPDPGLLAPRARDDAPAYAPPPPVRRRRLSATTRFYLGFWTAVVLLVALSAAIGYRAGVANGSAAAAAGVKRALGLEAQCLRDLKLGLENPAAGSTASGGAYGKTVAALAGADRCAEASRLPALSAADLRELSGVDVSPAGLPPPGDPRWAAPSANPPRAGGASGITVRSGVVDR